MPPNTAQVCLVHGQDVEAINQTRDRTLDALIPAEARPENLTDYIATSNRALRLADIGWDIVSELSTLSLFEDSRRVVVVTDLADLCEAGGRRRAPKKSAAKAKTKRATKKKADPVEKFCDFLTRGLLQTPNAIVFLNYEKSYETAVAKTSPLYKAIQQAGWVQECRGENKTFALEDALRARDAAKAVRLYRDLKGSASPNMIFNTLLRLTRSLLQAKVVAVKRRSGAKDEDLRDVLPKDRSGFFNQHAFVQKKNLGAAQGFSVAELAAALRELLELNRLVIPLPTDVYVRDLSLATELWILKWFSTPDRTNEEW